MSIDLSQQLLSQLKGAPLQAMSRQLGLDPAHTAASVGSALPLMFSAVGRNAGSPQGVTSLLAALRGNTAAAAGDAAAPTAAAANDGMLTQMLGSDRLQAVAQLTQLSGLDAAKAVQLMQMLAPLVARFLSQHTAQLGQLLTPGMLGGLLGQGAAQQPDAAQSGLGGLLRSGSALLGAGKE